LKKLIGAVFFVQILVIGGWMYYFAPPIEQAVAKPQGAPETVLQNYYKLAVGGDYMAMYDLLDDSTQAAVTEEEIKKHVEALNGGGILLADVFSASSTGKFAVIPFVLANGGGQSQLQIALLTNEGGDWKMVLGGSDFSMDKVKTILQLAVDAEKAAANLMMDGKYQGNIDANQLLSQLMPMLQSHSQALEMMNAPTPEEGMPNDGVHNGGQAPNDAVHGGQQPDSANGAGQAPDDAVHGGGSSDETQMPNDAVHGQAQQNN